MSIAAAHENHHDVNTDGNNDNDNDNDNDNNGELMLVQIIEAILSNDGTRNSNPKPNANPNLNWDAVHCTHEFKLAQSKPHTNMKVNTTATPTIPTMDGGRKT